MECKDMCNAEVAQNLPQIGCNISLQKEGPHGPETHYNCSVFSLEMKQASCLPVYMGITRNRGASTKTHFLLQFICLTFVFSTPNYFFILEFIFPSLNMCIT